MCCSHSIEEREKENRAQDVFDLGQVKGMQFFDPHVHMTSRTTDDYQAMADFPLKGTVRASVVVHDPRFNVTFSHPDTVRKDIEYSTYSFITNMSGAAQDIRVASGLPSCTQSPSGWTTSS